MDSRSQSSKRVSPKRAPSSGSSTSCAQLHAVIAGARVSDNLARIVACGESAAHHVIEVKLLWTADFKRTVNGRAHRDVAQRTCHIVGRHRLDEPRWQVILVALCRKVGNGIYEFEELRRADN